MDVITRQENVLFTKWARRRAGEAFYKDGVAFPEEYSNSSIKTVFLLREANLKDEPRNYDLRSILRNTKKDLDWWDQKMSRFCYGISNPKKTWDQTNSDSMALRPFGFIQLKKTPGVGRSNAKKLRAVAQEDKELLRQQLAIYAPEVIIACGLGSPNTFDLLLETVFKNASKTIKSIRGRQSVKIHDEQISTGSIYIIETYHPAARKSRETMYNTLVRLFRHVANEREKPSKER